MFHAINDSYNMYHVFKHNSNRNITTGYVDIIWAYQVWFDSGCKGCISQVFYVSEYNKLRVKLEKKLDVSIFFII